MKLKILNLYNIFVYFKLHDILKTKIEKRPNREILVQKNILPGKFNLHFSLISEKNSVLHSDGYHFEELN